MGAFIRTPLYYKADPNRQPAPEGTEPVRDAERDSLVVKILKYVPAEAIALFTPAVAFFNSQNTLTDNSMQVYTLLLLAIGFVGAPIYLWWKSRLLSGRERPVWFYYLLCTFAFPIWALATSDNVRSAISAFSFEPFFSWDGTFFGGDTVSGIAPGDAEIALFLAAFIIPVLDAVLTAWFVKSAPQV